MAEKTISIRLPERLVHELDALQDKAQTKDKRGNLETTGPFIRRLLAELLLDNQTNQILSHLDLAQLGIASAKQDPATAADLEHLKQYMTEVRRLLKSMQQGLPAIAAAALAQFGKIPPDDADRLIQDILHAHRDGGAQCE